MDDLKSQLPRALIPEVNLQAKVREIADRINADYAGHELTAICVLKGSFVFFSDIIRHLDLPVTCEFLGISSYGAGMASSGEVKVTLDINEPLEGRNIVVFEDIVDTGLSLSFILNLLRVRRPASIRTCALLMKPEKLRTNVEVDYFGFTIGDEFVVGYGIDHAEKYRELPYIGYIEQEH